MGGPIANKMLCKFISTPWNFVHGDWCFRWNQTLARIVRLLASLSKQDVLQVWTGEDLHNAVLQTELLLALDHMRSGAPHEASEFETVCITSFVEPCSQLGSTQPQDPLL